MDPVVAFELMLIPLGQPIYVDPTPPIAAEIRRLVLPSENEHDEPAHREHGEPRTRAVPFRFVLPNTVTSTSNGASVSSGTAVSSGAALYVEPLGGFHHDLDVPLRDAESRGIAELLRPEATSLMYDYGVKMLRQNHTFLAKRVNR